MIETIEKLVAKRTGMSPAFANLLANEIVDALKEKFVFQRKPNKIDRETAEVIEQEARIQIANGNQGLPKILRIKMGRALFGWSLKESSDFVEANFKNKGTGGPK